MRWMWSLVIPVWMVCACGETEDDAEVTNDMTVEVWGEDLIESGMTADDMADGWALKYNKFLINLGKISVAEEDEDAAATRKDMEIWDLTEAGPHKIFKEEIPVGEYTHTTYSISPATSKSVSGNATDEDVDEMVDNGYSVLVSGEATKDDKTITFTWGFTTDTEYDPCESKGKLSADKAGTIQITIHGDHLFYDDAASEDPDLRFEDIALADENEDGDVTMEELSKYEIDPLDHYGYGSLDIENNMEAYISHMTSTLGHIDGEGHCG